MKKNILVVDDEEHICTMIKDYLECYDFNVEIIRDSINILKFIENEFDLIILDVMMPGLDGLEVCKLIRDKTNSPIMFLSAKALEDDKIQGLIVGADDYMVKPFSLKELKAKIESHIRRDRRTKLNEIKLINTGNLSIDIQAKKVFCKGHLIDFTKTEYSVLELLVINKNQVLTKDNIFSKVWDCESESTLEVVTEVIKNIRKKIKKYDDKKYISTNYGLGYIWNHSAN